MQKQLNIPFKVKKEKIKDTDIFLNKKKYLLNNWW